MVLVRVCSVLVKDGIQPFSIFHYIYIQEPMSQKLSNNIRSLACNLKQIFSAGSYCDKYGPFGVILVFLGVSICYYGSKSFSLIVV